MEVDDTPEDEHALDLYWHALNYRTASSEHAEAMWLELEACVVRLMEGAREDASESARDWYERNYTDAR